MSESHLKNAIAMLERGAENAYPGVVSAGWMAYSMVSSEMAEMDFEQGLNQLEAEGWEALLPSSYYDLCAEVERRGIK